jgi:hypothetical protein
MSTLAPPLLSSYEVCDVAGISYRQLDYWCRCDVIRPEQDARGSGTRRRFTHDQTVQLATCARVAGELSSGGDGSTLVARLAAVVSTLSIAQEYAGPPSWLVVTGGRASAAWTGDELAEAIRGRASCVVLAVPTFDELAAASNA